MTDASEVARIAKGLTKGQREAVLSTEPEGVRDYAEIHGMPRFQLFRKGVFRVSADTRTQAFTLTPLGIAVRAHLLKATPDA